MGLPWVKIALLLTAFTSSFPHLASGAPAAQATEFAGKVPSLGDVGFPIPYEQTEEEILVARKEDGYFLEAAKVSKRINARGVRWPFKAGCCKFPLPGITGPPSRVAPPPPPAPSTPDRIEPPPFSRPTEPPIPAPMAPQEPESESPPSPVWRPITENDMPPGVGGRTGGIGRRRAKKMEVYAKIGKAQIAKYEKIVRSKKPDTTIVITDQESKLWNLFHRNSAFRNVRHTPGYEVYDRLVFLDWSHHHLRLFEPFGLGFTFPSELRLVETMVMDSGDPEVVPDKILRSTFDLVGRFIIYNDAFKEADTHNLIPLNEMGIQNFLHVAGIYFAPNLKAVFLNDIQNREFWTITRNNYNDMKKPYTEILSFERGTEQFNRYMGSPNIWSKFFSYGNHHNALGHPIPQRIVIMPGQVPEPSHNFIVMYLTAAIIFGRDEES